MKYSFFLLLLILATACQHFGKVKVDIPSFDLLLPDSVTHFNTNQIPDGKPIILLYFSPDCDHCQKETDSLLHNIEYLRHVQFYFITNDPIERIKVFNTYYKIYNYPNITLGQDYHFFFIGHFKPSGPPYLLIYDKNKRWRAVFKGEASVSQIVKFINTL
jgi:hypothetical protein